jgi:hypothetical protein
LPKLMWHFLREFPSLRVPLVTVEERIAQFREAKAPEHPLFDVGSRFLIFESGRLLRP